MSTVFFNNATKTACGKYKYLPTSTKFCTIILNRKGSLWCDSFQKTKTSFQKVFVSYKADNLRLREDPSQKILH